MRKDFKMRALFSILAVLFLALPASAQFTNAKRRPDPGPMPKNIHGIVTDLRGRPLPGAHVFIKDLKTNVIRTLVTDDKGILSDPRSASLDRLRSSGRVQREGF